VTIGTHADQVSDVEAIRDIADSFSISIPLRDGGWSAKGRRRHAARDGGG
jgi:hypothetical protein